MTIKLLNTLLGGEDVSPRYADQARALIGKRVQYLRDCDIDKSGRGYYFPRYGLVQDVYRRNLMIDGDWIDFRNIREMRVIEPTKGS